MYFEFEVGDQKKWNITFYRGWFFGTMRIKVDGRLVAWSSALNPLTHYSPALARACRFHLDEDVANEVVIVQVRPRLLGGCRPHDYYVFWRGLPVVRHRGY